MSHFHTAAQSAINAGFTHILASDGTLTEIPRDKCRAANMPVNGWHFLNFEGEQVIGIFKNRKPVGFYRLANVTNGYKIKFNSAWDKFQVSHPEIGFCAEFYELSDAIEYAKKG